MLGIQHLVVILLIADTGADTVLPNPLTGLLTSAGSPYVSDNDVNVPEGQAVTIEGGTVIRFSPGRGLDVHGRIHIQATDRDKVTFTTWEEKKAVPVQPPGVKLVNQQAPGRGQYKKSVKYATISYNYVLRSNRNVCFLSGTLLMLRTGSWRGLCDSRVSNKQWNTNLATVSIPKLK